jgi:drug/metabolite transporter (DMT)-like permease
MPVFQFTTIFYVVGAATLFITRPTAPAFRRRAGQGRTLFDKAMPAIMVSVGLLLSNILFLHAVRFMPAAQANLIVYLWPLMVVLLGALFRLVTLRRHHFVSMALALCGAVLVIGPTVSHGAMAGSWTGLAFAVAAGLSWAVFCIYRVWQGANAPDALAPGLALSAVISAIMHVATETTVMPSNIALLSAVLNGAIPLALGNLAWDHGIRRGDRVLLAVAAYATPLVSALILIAFGLAEATTGLFIGGILIVSGGIISARR